VAQNTFKLKRKSLGSSIIQTNPHENSYGYANPNKERFNKSKDMSDYWVTAETEMSFKKKNNLWNYFNQKNKFIGKDPTGGNQKDSISTYRNGGELIQNHQNSISMKSNYSSHKSFSRVNQVLDEIHSKVTVLIKKNRPSKYKF